MKDRGSMSRLLRMLVALGLLLALGLYVRYMRTGRIGCAIPGTPEASRTGPGS